MFKSSLGTLGLMFINVLVHSLNIFLPCDHQNIIFILMPYVRSGFSMLCTVFSLNMKLVVSPRFPRGVEVIHGTVRTAPCVD